MADLRDAARIGPTEDRVRRIGLFSDVHGNMVALEAVLEDMRATGVREHYCLGDLVGYGPDPVGVIDLIRAERIPCVLGNYDEGIGTRRGECGCYYATEQAKRDGEASYAFTVEAVDDEHAAWLAALPPEIRLQERGVRILLVHGSPRKVNEYLTPDRSDAQLARLATAAEADVVCIGHVHVPYHRLVTGTGGTIHYVSSGSAGKPKDGDPRACWIEVFVGPPDDVLAATPSHATATSAGATETWVATEIHRVAYDVAAVERAMLRAGLPATLAAALRSA